MKLWSNELGNMLLIFKINTSSTSMKSSFSIALKTCKLWYAFIDFYIVLCRPVSKLIILEELYKTKLCKLKIYGRVHRQYLPKSFKV